MILYNDHPTKTAAANSGYTCPLEMRSNIIVTMTNVILRCHFEISESANDANGIHR